MFDMHAKERKGLVVLRREERQSIAWSCHFLVTYRIQNIQRKNRLDRAEAGLGHSSVVEHSSSLHQTLDYREGGEKEGGMEGGGEIP